MNWFSSIKDLQYYNQTPGVSCYCEALIFPNDMMLQGSIPAGQGSGNYTINIEVWSPDGLTAYEIATSYFDYYFFVNPINGLHYFTARLKSFSPAMCSHKCFLIRVGVTNTGSPNNYLFANWTERYCVSDCCDTARGIIITQDGLIAQPLVSGSIDAVLPGVNNMPTGECGEPLIRLISKSDCYDAFTGDYYGSDGTVLSGTAVAFVKVTTMRGRIVRKPRDIKREISYNCRLQSSESTPQYLLEGFEFFPAWKMYEIENQLHANHIWVDDFTNYKKYQYAGGTPFKQVSKCRELFKLETMLEDCTQRQIFGCGDCKPSLNFDGSMRAYAIPGAYNGGGFYNERKALVAEDYDGLQLYLRAQNSVTAVSDVDISSLDCGLYKVTTVSGTGTLPSYLYYDSPVSTNRVFGVHVPNIEDLCTGNGEICKKPVTGIIDVEELICNTPETGTVVVADIVPEDVIIGSYGSWIVDMEESAAHVYSSHVVFAIHSTNESLVATGEEGEVFIPNDVIGVIGAAARPSTMVLLNHDNNSSVPEGLIITIEPNGLIRATGPATDADESGTSVVLGGLIYTL